MDKNVEIMAEAASKGKHFALVSHLWLSAAMAVSPSGALVDDAQQMQDTLNKIAP